jgi:hypothetical protein
MFDAQTAHNLSYAKHNVDKEIQTLIEYSIRVGTFSTNYELTCFCEPEDQEYIKTLNANFNPASESVKDVMVKAHDQKKHLEKLGYKVELSTNTYYTSYDGLELIVTLHISW